ncbi:hypothetical protein BYT27DRAFT_7180654 [Phlegmacium glaucopus]|nr:hypothetical protein BYT27DRAFT_7180654 [Phlegmacium glaucopus]
MATQYSKDKPHFTGHCSPFRRRRFGLLIFILLGFFFYFVPWELPPSLKGADFSYLSRANVAQLIKSKKVEVGEIYGLLHLMTGDNEQEHVLSNVHLDPTVSVEMSVYAAGDTSIDWEKERKSIDVNYPIVVFSKRLIPIRQSIHSFSSNAKRLLAAYDIQPLPKIIEVDIRDDGNMIKPILTRLTDHSTFPNILFKGKSIGGWDKLNQLHSDKTLAELIEQAGATARSDGSGK